MTRFLRIFLLLMVVCATFTACSSDDDDAGGSSGKDMAEELADYTLLIYGSTGGNLDDYLQYTLSQIGLADATENVNVAAVVKYSKDQQDSIASNLRGTPYYRKAAGQRGFNVTTYADASYDITDADNFADVVNMVVEDLPAKKYILVLWNHGQSFSLYDTPLSTTATASAASTAAVSSVSSASSGSSSESSTRAFLQDDNISDQTIMSVFSLAEGIKRCTVDKFEAIIGELCLFNNVEQLYELQPYCNYVLGSASYIPAVGYDYPTLLTQLDSSPSDVATALTACASSSMDTWGQLAAFEGAPMELSVFDMSALPAVVSALGDVCSRYITLYDYYSFDQRNVTIMSAVQLSCQTEYPVSITVNGQTQSVTWEYGGYMYYYDSQLNSGETEYRILSFTSPDVLSTFDSMVSVFNNDSLLTDYVGVLRSALDNMTVSMVKKDFPMSVDDNICGLSMIWTDKLFYESSSRVVGNYEFYLTYGSTLSDTYPYTAFDQETGWSEFFSMNDTPYSAVMSMGGMMY